MAISRAGAIRALKITVSLALLGLLLSRVDWPLVADYLSRLETLPLLAAFLILAVQFPISTWKWQKSLEAHDLTFPFASLFTVLCIGFFFNSFLPTSIGGDGYRIARTWPKGGERPSRAISAVVVERLAGFGVLVGLGLLGAMVARSTIESPLLASYVRVCAAGAVLALAMLAMARWDGFAGFRAWASRVKAVRPVIENLGYVRNARRKMVSLVLLSLVFQVLAITGVYLLFRSVGVPVGFASCAVIGAMSALAGLLPVSVNGLGVVEGSLVLAATELGVEFNNAVLVAFMLRILVVPLTLLCGLVYLIHPGQRHANA